MRHQGALALHLTRIRLPHEIQPIGLRIRELLPRVGFASGLDAACLGGAFGGTDPRHLVGFSLELALLDLFLFEGQNVLHGFLLRARCDDLFLAGRFRRRLPPHLVGLGFELLLLDLRLLELQGVMDLLGLELLRQKLLHAGPIIRRQIHLPHVDAAQHQSHGIELGLELGDQLALDVRPPLREDLAHGVPGKGGVDDSLDRWRDEVRADVVGKFLRHLGEAGSIHGPANREVDADRQSLDRLKRGGTRGARAFERPIHLVANRVAAHLVDAGQHQHGARGVDTGRAVECIGAYQDLPASHGLEGRVQVQPIDEQGRERADEEPPANAPRTRDEGQDGCGQ